MFPDDRSLPEQLGRALLALLERLADLLAASPAAVLLAALPLAALVFVATCLRAR